MTPQQMAELAARLRYIQNLLPTWLDDADFHAYEADLRNAANLIDSMAQREPAAWMWQHDETGRIGFIDQWQVDSGWEGRNPQCKIVGPLYLAPPARREPLTDEQIDKALQTDPHAILLLADACRLTTATFKDVLRRLARVIEQAHGIRGEK